MTGNNNVQPGQKQEYRNGGVWQRINNAAWANVPGPGPVLPLAKLGVMLVVLVCVSW
jgi:hypothetical protein